MRGVNERNLSIKVDIYFVAEKFLTIEPEPLSAQERRENWKHLVTHGISIFLIALFGVNMCVFFAYGTPVNEQLQMVVLIVVGFYLGRGYIGN